MSRVLTAPNNIRANHLSVGAATGSQIFHTCCWLYLIAFFILPDGFGFRLGFLWSAKRIMMFVCYAMILFNKERLTEFWQDIKSYKLPNTFILLYEFIRVYTAIYRTDLYCIYNSLLDEILVFYLFAYILKHEFTTEKFIEFIRITLLILCIEGIWEVATGINLFGFLNFAGSDTWAAYATRAGGSRISGNCHHAIHFGIYLTILFFISCVDVKKNKIYLFRSPALFFLSSVCVFLTGSRAPLGIYILGVFLICLLSNKDERRKSLVILALFLSIFAIFTMIVYRTGIGRQIMFMLTAMWDALFDTEFSVNWGGSLKGSTDYREALAKVFDLWYFNKIMGRGISYSLSVVIDGYWLRSCDNSYVSIYICYAYPGMITLIAHGLLIIGYSIKGLFVHHKMLFASILVITICYFLNIWYVAMMGTYMYIWMLLALAYINFKGEDKKEKLQ